MKSNLVKSIKVLLADNLTRLSDWITSTNSALALRLSQHTMVGGGTSSWDNLNYSWTGTYLVDNFYQITQPPDTTPINLLGGAYGTTWTAVGLYLGKNVILLYQLPVGGDGSSVDANFYLTDTMDPTVIPANCVVLAVRNATLSGGIRTGLGVNLSYGQSWTQEAGFAPSTGDVAVNWAAKALTVATDQSHSTPFVQVNDVYVDFVVNSGLFPTSGTLSATMPINLKAYVLGERRLRPASSYKTFPASRDTYVDWSRTGMLTFPFVANGAAAPAVTADSIRLCKVVTNATAITATSRIALYRPFLINATGNPVFAYGYAVNAYTSDPESSAYTGIDNAQAGTVYATVADLNTLRIAYDNLRASYDDLLTKLKTSGIVV